MGYFPNGTSCDLYEHEYCSRCVHRKGKDGKSGCAVMLSHIMHNYEECDKEDSILHILIERDGIENLECSMFFAGDPPQPVDS